VQDYHELHGWSVENYDLFWQEVWQFTGVIRQAGTFSSTEMKQCSGSMPLTNGSRFGCGCGSFFFHH
jgi:hypothetical protein